MNRSFLPRLEPLESRIAPSLTLVGREIVRNVTGPVLIAPVIPGVQPGDTLIAVEVVQRDPTGAYPPTPVGWDLVSARSLGAGSDSVEVTFRHHIALDTPIPVGFFNVSGGVASLEVLDYRAVA